ALHGLFLLSKLGLSEFIEPVAESFNEERKLLGIGFGGGTLCNFVPVGIGELGMIRVAVVGHSRTFILRICVMPAGLSSCSFRSRSPARRSRQDESHAGRLHRMVIQS